MHGGAGNAEVLRYPSNFFIRLKVFAGTFSSLLKLNLGHISGGMS
jgi:hypothetical protein